MARRSNPVSELLDVLKRGEFHWLEEAVDVIESFVPLDDPPAFVKEAGETGLENMEDYIDHDLMGRSEKKVAVKIREACDALARLTEQISKADEHLRRRL